MSTVDQFASVFNAASQTAFQHKPPALENALVVTDLGSEAAEKFTENARSFFGGVTGAWNSIHGGEFATVKELLNLVESRKPGFIVTYRHLHSEAWRWPYSLGEHLDVLIQESAPPVAILPHPDREGVPEHTLKNTDSVMVINSHLVGEDCLVNHAASLTSIGGTLHLTHVEDDTVFDRYLDVISKIPEIDTDVARETIREQLLREPASYIDSCETALREAGIDLTVIKHVTHGHRLEEYRRAIEDHQVDLVVLQGHDEDQLAMNATAYSVAVELRTTPLLIV